MPRYIGKIEDKYFEYSTIANAPVTILMSLEEFKEFYFGEYGRVGMQGLQDRLKRVDGKGTSSWLDKSLKEMISGNRYGDQKKELNLQEFIEKIKKETASIRSEWEVSS